MFFGAGCISMAPKNDQPAPSATAPTPTPVPAVNPVEPLAPNEPAVKAKKPVAKIVSVTITDTAFAPQQMAIRVGDTVVWTNKSKWDHTVTGLNSTLLWDSGNLKTGKTYQRTFHEPGTYKYHCGIHANMTGEIIVGEVKPAIGSGY